MFFIPQEASTLSILGKHGKERNVDLAYHIHNELGSLDETPTHLDKKQNTKHSKHQSFCTTQEDSNHFLGIMFQGAVKELSASWYEWPVPYIQIFSIRT